MPEGETQKPKTEKPLAEKKKNPRDTLTPEEVANVDEKIAEKHDEIEAKATEERAALAKLIGVGKTPKDHTKNEAGEKDGHENTASEKAKSAPLINADKKKEEGGKTSPSETREKIIKPLTGTEFVQKLEEAEKNDPAPTLQQKIRNTLKRMREMAIEQISIKNLSYKTTSVPFEYTGKDGKKMKITLEVGKISVDNFDVPVDGPLAKQFAEGVGGTLPTKQVMDAFEKVILKEKEEPGKRKGVQFSFTPGPELAARILKDPNYKNLDPQIRASLTEWTKDPNHPPGEMMQWIGMFKAANQASLEKRKDLQEPYDDYGDYKTIVMDDRQQSKEFEDTLCLWGAINPVTKKKLQTGEGFPHDRRQHDYSQRPTAVFSCTIDGDKYDFQDVVGGGDEHGRITSLDGKKTIDIGDAWKLFTPQKIDYAKIYPDIHLPKKEKAPAPPANSSTPEAAIAANEDQHKPKTTKDNPPPIPDEARKNPPAFPPIPDEGAKISAISSPPTNFEASNASVPPKLASFPTPAFSENTLKLREKRVPIAKREIDDEPPTVSRAKSADISINEKASPGPLQEDQEEKTNIPESGTIEPMPEKLDIPPGKKFFLLGDSHSDGIGNWLKQAFGKEKITHLHSSRNNYKMSQSQTISDLNEIYSQQIDGEYPDEDLEGSTVAVSIGANDLFANKSFQQIKNQLNDLLEKLHNKKMKVVLSTIPPVGDHPKVTPKILEQWQKLNNWIKGETVDGETRDPKLVDQVVDLATPFENTADKTKIDQQIRGSTIHLSPEGYKQAASLFAKGVNQVNEIPRA